MQKFTLKQHGLVVRRKRDIIHDYSSLPKKEKRKKTWYQKWHAKDKIRYFPSQFFFNWIFFENLKFPENNIISVEAANIVGSKSQLWQFIHNSEPKSCWESLWQCLPKQQQSFFFLFLFHFFWRNFSQNSHLHLFFNCKVKRLWKFAIARIRFFFAPFFWGGTFVR